MYCQIQLPWHGRSRPPVLQRGCSHHHLSHEGNPHSSCLFGLSHAGGQTISVRVYSQESALADLHEDLSSEHLGVSPTSSVFLPQWWVVSRDIQGDCELVLRGKLALLQIWFGVLFFWRPRGV